MRKTISGFTIVELLIVIVVITILAAISIVAYTGVQTRARDSARTDAIGKIKKALELYKIDNGRYPTATANPGVSGWELSTDTSGTFMEYLAPYGFTGGAPTDPLNNATYRFMYHRYPAGGYSNGCDLSKGGFYILSIRYENINNKPAGNSIVDYCTTPQGVWSDNPSSTTYSFSSFEN